AGTRARHAHAVQIGSGALTSGVHATAGPGAWVRLTPVMRTPSPTAPTLLRATAISLVLGWALAGCSALHKEAPAHGTDSADATASAAADGKDNAHADGDAAPDDSQDQAS